MNGDTEESIWNFSRLPKSLPIYASGKAFIADSFDSLLVQCFYRPILAQFFEALVLGQKFQTTFQIDLPVRFCGQKFSRVYRFFISRNILVMAIYRATTDENGALFPYVYLSPRRDSTMHADDRLFVYTNPFMLQNALDEIAREKELIDSSGTNDAYFSDQKSGDSRLPEVAKVNYF